jgi:hypothetical protein
VIDWNAYRAAYDGMTFEEVVRFHDQVWEQFPSQEYYSPDHLAAFFSDLGAVNVVEVGGWRGEAAEQILPAYPVQSWTNYEICRSAALSPITDDPRYTGVHLDRWAWEMPVRTFDVGVLAHVIEHVRAPQLRSLIEWLSLCEVRHLYVEAPLIDVGRSWRNSTSAHVLEIGWPDVIRLLGEFGFYLTSRGSHGDIGEVLTLRRDL